MQNGGKRAGAGRKAGGINKRTAALRAIADKAVDQGITPLEVMLNNMRFYVEEADKLLAQILLGKKSTPALTDALKGLVAFRTKAQECAADAAPYVHPRLASHIVSGDPNAPLEVVHVIEHVITADPIRQIKRTDSPRLLSPA